MDKVDHLRVRQFAREIKVDHLYNFKAFCEGNMDKVDHCRVRQGSTILRRTICEGNMDKVDHWF